MRWKAMSTLLTMMWLAGCATTPSAPAICDATRGSRADLADALLADGGPRSQRAGLLVLDQVAAGCAG